MSVRMPLRLRVLSTAFCVPSVWEVGMSETHHRYIQSSWVGALPNTCQLPHSSVRAPVATRRDGTLTTKRIPPHIGGINIVVVRRRIPARARPSPCAHPLIID